jgi:alpha-N-arabinofuranosidase
MGGAIATGGFLNMLLRTADIVPIADMTGIIEFGGIWKKRSRSFGTPAYWVFRMYSTADAKVPVETTSSVENYKVVNGPSRFPSIENVPYLDVVATLNTSGVTLTLFCVNRDLTRDLQAEIQLSGFRANRQGRATTLHAESIYEKNDEVQPELVHPYIASSTFQPRVSTTTSDMPVLP